MWSEGANSGGVYLDDNFGFVGLFEVLPFL